MATKLVRLTRHEAEQVQLAELNRIFGEVEVSQVSETLPTDPRGAVKRFDEIVASAEVVEAVLPVNILEAVLKFSAFTKRGGRVIRAATKRNLRPDGSTTFDFLHYEEIKKVEVITEKL